QYPSTPEVSPLSLHDALPIYEDQETVARQIDRYDLIAIPVVDASDMLVGIITHDDAMDILRQEQTEDILAFGGVSRDSEANEERSEEHTSELQSRGHLVCRLP